MPNIYQKFNKVAQKNRERTVLRWKSGRNWKSMTYKKFVEKVDDFAGGLFEIGVERKKRVAILSENRPEWLIADLAINKLNAISVPIHITSNKSLVEFILEDSSSNFLLLSNRLFLKHVDFFENWEGKIVFLDEVGDKNYDKEDFFSFNEIIEKQGVISSAEENVDLQNEIASIIYTSGTTGNPKGVALSNKNFLFNIESAKDAVALSPSDRFLSFLPLSHVLERTVGSYVPIFSGCSISYVESIQKLQENMKEVKPTILISVPKIFERIYEKIFFQANSGSSVARKVFFWALKQKEPRLRRFIADKLVYKKIRKVFGNKFRFAVSGGASLNDRIIKFFENVGIEIIEGYGMTETAPLISTNSLVNKKIGTVGMPVKGVDVRIALDKEILVKGGNVMLGYWQNEEATKEILDKDGWLKTGDLGSLDSDNFLTIVGRKKDIIVLSNGNNISPERIEGIINLSPYVDQSLVVGHKKRHLTALITVDKEKVSKDFREEIDLKKIVREELEKINKKLPPFENIKNFTILDKSFVIEKDELTPTLKIRRKILEIKYEKLINKMYIN